MVAISKFSNTELHVTTNVTLQNGKENERNEGGSLSAKLWSVLRYKRSRNSNRFECFVSNTWKRQLKGKERRWYLINPPFFFFSSAKQSTHVWCNTEKHGEEMNIQKFFSCQTAWLFFIVCGALATSFCVLLGLSLWVPPIFSFQSDGIPQNTRFDKVLFPRLQLASL